MSDPCPPVTNTSTSQDAMSCLSSIKTIWPAIASSLCSFFVPLIISLAIVWRSHNVAHNLTMKTYFIIVAITFIVLGFFLFFGIIYGSWIFETYTTSNLDAFLSKLSVEIQRMIEFITNNPDFNTPIVRAFITAMNDLWVNGNYISDYVNYHWGIYIDIAMTIFIVILLATMFIGLTVVIARSGMSAKEVDLVFKLSSVPLFFIVGYLAGIVAIVSYFRDGVIEWQNGDNLIINYLISDCRTSFRIVKAAFKKYIDDYCVGDITGLCELARDIYDKLDAVTDCDIIFNDLANAFPLDEYTQVLIWVCVSFGASVLLVIALAIFIAAPHPRMGVTVSISNEPQK